MNPPPPPGPAQPRVVLKNTSGRDTLVAVLIGVALLAAGGYGVMTMSKTHEPENILVGVVTEKIFAPRREAQIMFTGRKLEGSKEIDGEYALRVTVEKEHRVYEVPVEKWAYEGKQVGDRMEFVRPPSEQK